MEIAIAILSIIFGSIFVVNLGLKRKVKDLEQKNEGLSDDKKLSELEIQRKEIESIVANTSIDDLINRKRNN